MILGEIRRYLRDNNMLRVSRGTRDTAYHALSVKEVLVKKLGRDPTSAEIAKEMGVPEENVVAALEAIVDPISIYEPVYSPRETSIIIMRFFRGKTQMEIAEEIGISQAQVSRIEKSALERIKRGM